MNKNIDHTIIWYHINAVTILCCIGKNIMNHIQLIQTKIIARLHQRAKNRSYMQKCEAISYI